MSTGAYTEGQEANGCTLTLASPTGRGGFRAAVTKRVAKSSKAAAALPPDYGPLLAHIKARVLALYWDIGRLILDRQKREGWGAKVIDRLPQDLQRPFPGQQGFSRATLLSMLAFADAWSETPIVLQPVGQLAPGEESQPATGAIVQVPPARTDWSAGAGEHRRSFTLTISGKERVSPHGENTLFSETVAVPWRPTSIEWLPEARPNSRISQGFIFE